MIRVVGDTLILETDAEVVIVSDAAPIIMK